MNALSMPPLSESMIIPLSIDHIQEVYHQRLFCFMRFRCFVIYFGRVSTPSYSLLAIYSSVRWKCFLGFSSADAFSVVLRLLWINSMRPFRYFVVTCSQKIKVLANFFFFKYICLHPSEGNYVQHHSLDRNNKHIC